MKIGILGGTFDPIHFGHLRTAAEIGQLLELEMVYLIPAATPPHKNSAPVTSFQHRLNMVRMAVEDNSLLEILDIEGKRPGLSYSIETLREIHGMFDQEPELFFILGTDAFLEIETWKEYRKLFDYSHFIVIQRAGHEEKILAPLLKKIRRDISATGDPNIYTTASGKIIKIMTSTLLEISSTRIRQMILKGESVHFLLPEKVREYIIQNGLYR